MRASDPVAWPRRVARRVAPSRGPVAWPRRVAPRSSLACRTQRSATKSTAAQLVVVFHTLFTVLLR